MIKRRLEKLEAHIRKSTIVPFIIVRRGGPTPPGTSNKAVIINIIPRLERVGEGTTQ